MSLWDNKKLQQVCQARSRPQRVKPLGELLDKFLRQAVIPRQKKLSRLGRAWQELLPPELGEHSCPESLHSSRLRILVDDAASMYELELLLKEGLLEQLRTCCPRMSISQVKLVRGQWYHIDDEGNKISEF